MKRYYRSCKGFTLIELLTSIMVLVTIGAVIAGMIASSFRGSNKTNTIENIRQNGNYVLNQISKDIAYAQSFDGITTGFSNNGGEYGLSCDFVSGVPKYITVRSTKNVVTKYYCNGSILGSSNLSANGNSLIDSSISLNSCSFTCDQDVPTDAPIVGISFTLGPGNSNNLVENSSPPITFKTSIVLRNHRN